MPKRKTTPEPIPQEVIDAIDTTPDEKMLENLKQNHRRILSVDKKQIGDTIFVVYNVVPESCPDEEHFLADAFERVKRLIIEDTKREYRDKFFKHKK